MVNNMKVPYKTKNRTTIWPCNLLLGIYKEKKHDSKRYMHSNVHCSTAYNGQDVEVSINTWIDKAEVIHSLRGMLFSHEKGWKCGIRQKNGGPCGRCDVMWNKLQRRSKYCMASLLCWLQKKKSQLQNRQLNSGCQGLVSGNNRRGI